MRRTNIWIGRDIMVVERAGAYSYTQYRDDDGGLLWSGRAALAGIDRTNPALFGLE